MTDDTRARVVALLADELDVDGLDDDASLFDEAGLDSAGIMRLVTGIEDEFEVEIPDADLRREHFASVRAVVTYVASRLSA